MRGSEWFILHPGRDLISKGYFFHGGKVLRCRSRASILICDSAFPRSDRILKIIDEGLGFFPVSINTLNLSSVQSSVRSVLLEMPPWTIMTCPSTTEPKGSARYKRSICRSIFSERACERVNTHKSNNFTRCWLLQIFSKHLRLEAHDVSKKILFPESYYKWAKKEEREREKAIWSLLLYTIYF